ncbi:MFS transporter [Salinirubrum litoreum]|uniref:MFS transporter n=1 Tax=Salinirubrum litoreum TaxID=1126234 RepID=A0ABD5RG02_9EURY
MTTRQDRTALAGIVFLVLFAQVLLYPGIDALVAALGAETRLSASMWFLAVEYAAFVAFAVVWGALSDATGRRVPFVVCGALGGAVGYAVLAFVPVASFETILLLRLFQGATTIGAFSLAITMLMDLPGGHGRNMGSAGIAIGGGTALGAPIGGQLYEVGPLVPVAVAAGLFVLVALLALTVNDRAPGERGTSHPSAAADTGGSRLGAGAVSSALSGLARRPILLVPYAFGFVDRLTAGFFALVGTLYFRETFTLSPGETGLLLACFFAPFALLQYPFGKLSDRVGRVAPVLAGSAVYGLVVIVVGLAPTATTAAIAMVGVGVVGALMAPATMALVTDLASETERGAAMAGFNVFGSLGFLAGVLVGGTVAGLFGYFWAFVVAGGIELLVVVLSLPALSRLSVGTDRSPVLTD